MSKYVFKPYNPLFPELFQKEKARIWPHLPLNSLIEHVGSTAVPGLGGKGIIDIAVAVDFCAKEEAKQALERIGFEFRPAFSTEERFYFIIDLQDSEEGLRRYHLHLVDRNGKEWQSLVGFRDFLRSHPKELEEYADLKKKAALEANQDGSTYRTIKEPAFQRFKMHAQKLVANDGKLSGSELTREQTNRQKDQP